MKLPYCVSYLQLGTHGKDQKSLLLSSYSEVLEGTMYMQIDKVGWGQEVFSGSDGRCCDWLPRCR